MQHVLVIRLSALGDAAMMAPLVRRYAEANPRVLFTVAAPPLLQPLFEGCANVEFLGLKKKQSVMKIYRALEAVGADTVVDLHKVNRVGYALTLMRLRHLFNLHFRIYALHKGRLSRWLFLHHLCRRPRRPQYERYNDVFLRAGLVAGKRVPDVVRAAGGGDAPTVGVAPFAQHQAGTCLCPGRSRRRDLLDARLH